MEDKYLTWIYVLEYSYNLWVRHAPVALLSARTTQTTRTDNADNPTLLISGSTSSASMFSTSHSNQRMNKHPLSVAWTNTHSRDTGPAMGGREQASFHNNPSSWLPSCQLIRHLIHQTYHPPTFKSPSRARNGFSIPETRTAQKNHGFRLGFVFTTFFSRNVQSRHVSGNIV